jgi:hypothetical protein
MRMTEISTMKAGEPKIYPKTNPGVDVVQELSLGHAR